MRTIWTILSTLAIANMLALGMVFGWLASTDRLSRERVDAVRKIFVTTSAQDKAEVVKKADDAKQQEALAEAERRKGFPPLTAEQRLELIREYADLIQQRTERTKRETQDLINTLLVQQSRLQQERQKLDEDKKAFEAMRAKIAEREGSEQFQKSLKVYQTLKPDVAAAMLLELVDKGDLEQVTAYLDAMAPRTASRIVTEIEKKSPELAASLIERLRLHGVKAPADPPVAAAKPEDPTKVVAGGASVK